MPFTISDLIVEALESAGVARVYGLPGDSLNGFTETLRKNGTIAWARVRHEEAAAFAAAGEAAVTGELAVCVAQDARRARRPGRRVHPRCRHAGDLGHALRAAFQHRGSALVEVMVAQQELAVPPAITFDQIKGFTLYATRSVLSGRLDELIDLARTNVTRGLFS